MAAGRPSKYDPKYCKKLVAHMSTGYSFETFAATIDVGSPQTLYAWCKKYPEFLEAKKKAFLHCRLFWEKAGIAGMWEGKCFNAAVWIFNMRNRFGWSEQQGTDDSEPKTYKFVKPIKREKKEKKNGK